MTDVSKLVLKVDSRQVRRARGDLGGLSKTGTVAQKSIGGVTKSAIKAGVAMLGFATAAAAAFKGVSAFIKVNAGFEQSLANVKAVTRATGEEMQDLENTARKLGASTIFSASQAADGMKFLGMAGFSTNQIIQAMPGLLDPAAASGMGLAETADIASNILTGFNMRASESGRVADVLAAAASSSNTSVQQLGEAMKFAAPVAASLGLDIEDAAAAIGVLSNAGIQGSMAGTALRLMLAKLVDPSDKAKAALKKYRIEIEEVNPATNKFTDILGTLAEAGVGVADMFKIFEIRGAASGLALAGNADMVEKLGNAFRDAKGRAAEMAAVMNDTLIGDVKIFGSAAQELALSLNDETGVTESLREATQAATEFVKSIDAEVISAQLDAILFKFSALTTGFDNALANIEHSWELTMGFMTTTGEVGANSITNAFLDMPENIRALVQLTGAEIGFLVEFGRAAGKGIVTVISAELLRLVAKAKVFGEKIGDFLNPFSTGNFDLNAELAAVDAFYTEIQVTAFDLSAAQIAAAGEARISVITDILDERDVALASYAERIAAAKALRAANRAARDLPPEDGGEEDGPTGKPKTTGLGGIPETDTALERIRLGLRTEEEAVQESYDNRKAIIEASTTDTGDLMARLNAERDDQEKAANIAKWEGALSEFGDFQNNMLIISKTGNTALGKVFKAAAIARAVITMHEGATKSYTAMADIPVVGPALAFAAKASAIVAGLASIQAISAQPIGGFAQGGIIPGSSPTGDNLTANVNSGEMILNMSQQRQLFEQSNGRGNDGGGSVVKIFNLPGQEAETRKDDSGNIEVFIKRAVQAVASGLASGDGPVDRALSPALARRGVLR